MPPGSKVSLTKIVNEFYKTEANALLKVDKLTHLKSQYDLKVTFVK